MPRRSRSPVGRVLADLGRVLDRLGLEWYLFGAQAAILRGLRRVTVDVDVTVFAPAHDGERLILALRGFALRVEDAADFARTTRVLPLRHRATNLDVDVVLGGPGLERWFLERAEPIEVEGRLVQIPITADLVLMKLIAGRERDIGDVVELVLFDRSAVDLAGLRVQLDELQAAVGEGDLLQALDAVERRLRGTAAPAGPRLPPRRRGKP